MKTLKKILAVAMTGVIAASFTVPAFADEVVKAPIYNSAEAAAIANGTVVLSAEELAGGQVVKAELTDSKTAAAAANGVVALSSEELAGTQIVKAELLTSADAAAAANAAWAGQN